MNEQLKVGKKGLHMFFCVCLMAVLTVTDFPVPEKEQGFPGPWLICGELQPTVAYINACGFCLRHADGSAFENVKVRFRKPDARPTVLAEDCTRIDTNGIESTVE